MICSENALQRLEYPQLKRLLAGQTQSEPGCREAAALLPLADSGQVVAALDEVDEAALLLCAGQAPTLGGCWALEEILNAGQAVGRLIAAEDLLKIGQSLLVMADCRQWFGQQPEAPALSAWAERIEIPAELQRRLRDSIGSRGELLDSASFELGDLRYRIRQLRQRIKQQLDQLLTDEHSCSCFQERLVTIRNGRYVVPLKSDCRGRVKGFIQDESASGQTLYLEPARVFEGNSQLQQLLREEQREERRILLQLADLVRRESPQLLLNQQSLARIDLRFAAARLSRAYQGCRPELSDESLIELKQVRHPLLLEKDGRFDPTAAVAIDLLIPQDCHALVISGPNTGGKSVALKTLGLLLLMLRSGLHIPCHPDSRVHPYQQLHVDIGDEQSIAQSISTFSGHLLKIREILAAADAETLVLLDEAGSGTDPAEGAALVQAVVDQLGRQGAKTLLTTHLGQLKLFAHSRPGINNAAVEFDPETLLPTYRIRYGIPGASSALTTAQRLGLPREVLDHAAAYLGSQELDQNALLVRLNERQQELDQELDQLRQARLQAETTQELRKQQLQRLKAERRKILDRASGQAEELIRATEARLKQLRKRQAGTVAPQQAVSDREQLSEARDALQPFRPRRKMSTVVPEQLQVGELVKIVALGCTARVVKAGTASIELDVSGKRMRQPLRALEQFSPRRFVEAQTGSGQVTRKVAERQVSSQLKLIGQRVDDALLQLGRFIDDALLYNLQQVEIVHGSGTGRLRRAVREYLAGETGVVAFYAAPAEQGGENITIAELNGR